MVRRSPQVMRTRPRPGRQRSLRILYLTGFEEGQANAEVLTAADDSDSRSADQNSISGYDGDEIVEIEIELSNLA